MAQLISLPGAKTDGYFVGEPTVRIRILLRWHVSAAAWHNLVARRQQERCYPNLAKSSYNWKGGKAVSRFTRAFSRCDTQISITRFTLQKDRILLSQDGFVYLDSGCARAATQDLGCSPIAQSGCAQHLITLGRAYPLALGGGRSHGTVTSQKDEGQHHRRCGPPGNPGLGTPWGRRAGIS